MRHAKIIVAASFVLALVVFLVWLIGPTPSWAPSSTDAQVTIGQATFDVMVADTAEKQVQGLSGISHLQPNQGMYFPQSHNQNPTFWMKDMLMGLDIIWIKHDRVIGIDANVPPPSPDQQTGDLPFYQSPQDFPQAVLEIPAGQAASAGIKVGDTVQFRP